MKSLKWVVLTLALLAVPTSVAYAQQITKTHYEVMNGINFGKISVLAKEFNIKYNWDSINNRLLLENNRGARVIIPVDSRTYDVSGEDYIAQVEVKNKNGEFWVPVKDFANVFNLSASYYSNTQRVVAEDKKLSDQTAVFYGEAIYYDKTWGNTVPKSIRKYGNPDNITRPVAKQTIYKQVKVNEVTEEVVQGKTKGE